MLAAHVCECVNFHSVQLLVDRARGTSSAYPLLLVERALLFAETANFTLSFSPQIFGPPTAPILGPAEPAYVSHFLKRK